MKPELKFYAWPILGYAQHPIAFKQAMSWNPDVLVSQGTSTDYGAYYLGSGKTNRDLTLYKRDLKLFLNAALKNKIPFIASLDAAGTDEQLNRILNVVDTVVREENLNLRVAVISGEIDPEWLKKKLGNGFKAKRLADSDTLSEELTIEDINESCRIVGQMGPEPIMKALELFDKGEIDGIFTGRAVDSALYSAFALHKGYSPDFAWLTGSYIHCGAMVAEPQSSSDGCFAWMDNESLIMRASNPSRRVTVQAVAEYSFYERENLAKELNPGGYLDVSNVQYEQVDETTVKCTNPKWVEQNYSIKLEGAKRIGYRSISIVGIRDPLIVKEIDTLVDVTRATVKERFPDYKEGKGNDYTLHFRIYGKDGVMGEDEPLRNQEAHELGIIIDVVGKTQEIATMILLFTMRTFGYTGFEGRASTAGAIAHPFIPTNIDLGEVYEFNVWHALENIDPIEPFAMKIVQFPTKEL